MSETAAATVLLRTIVILEITDGSNLDAGELLAMRPSEGVCFRGIRLSILREVKSVVAEHFLIRVLSVSKHPRQDDVNQNPFNAILTIRQMND